MAKTAIIFPGEFNGYVGMLNSCKHMPVVQDMMQSVSECFEINVDQLMREGPEELMLRTDLALALAYLGNSAAWEVLKQDHPDILEQPYAVAGFSVGEISALFAAGVVDFDGGLLIVKEWADAMQPWADEGKTVALSVYGLEEHDLQTLMREAKAKDQVEGGSDSPEVYISHYWSPVGFTASGLRSTVMQLKWLLRDNPNAIVHEVEHVRTALHTPLAEPIAETVGAGLSGVPFDPPQCDLYFNAGYRVSVGQDANYCFQNSMRHLTEPAYWAGIISTCIERGVTEFVECGPGSSLKDIMIFNVYSTTHMTVRPYEKTRNISV